MDRSPSKDKVEESVSGLVR